MLGSSQRPLPGLDGPVFTNPKTGNLHEQTAPAQIRPSPRLLQELWQPGIMVRGRGVPCAQPLRDERPAEPTPRAVARMVGGALVGVMCRSR